MTAEGRPDLSPGDAARLPTVSVVVSTYQRRDNLRQVVQPLLDDPATAEVVVVVDGSTDGSLELLQEMAATDPRLRPVGTANQGAAAARQHGVELATGDVVLLVDDDVVAAPGLVTGHRRHHVDQDVVVLGYMPTKPATGRGRFATRLYSAEYEGTCRAYERDPREVLLRLWGGNVSVRRNQLQRIPFDSGPFARLGHEDRDFGIRCLKAGLHGVFDRTLLASHEHRRPLGAFLRDARRFGAGRYGVHRVHSDVLGPYGLDDTVADLPAAARAIVSLDRWPLASAIVFGPVHLLARASSAVGLEAVEVPAAKFLRRLHMRRGIRQAMAGSDFEPTA